ncbi:hypothetical protein [Streptomyces europaeiscabiei]|uniref:hypothetical protein n=1 Tax=Streptomyces europaeiscabiei TaxID=146819 RepID=UPI0029AB8ACA|nr:hypothetical protein [Streptomyces europaeiscabiei]MDX3587547.1 hypothetical protein [Streptomyces europaeiscabiei]
MSAVAAPAAVFARRRTELSVPAGPVPERVAGHPLSLGRDARARLGGAVRALLDVAGLDGAPDAVRLAVLVLASRTPSETGVVEIRTSELGRWLGLSASYTASTVVSGLRRSGVVSVETAEGDYGQDDGLKCKVLPLWAAQDVVGHPLNLAKKEYATLWRLLEAVMAPGWTHRDGRVTPAGLIGTRTGRGAATDRLALLLLVLEARETGRVQQCGGTVDTKRGRAAATVARLLGCTASAGERVLERLEDRELVLRVRLKTGSGMPNRSRLMVPAVAAAHGRTVADDVQDDRAEALEEPEYHPDVAAGPGEAPETETESQVSGVLVTDEADVAEPDVAAALHTDHPHLVTPLVPLQLSGGFSGEGRGGFGDLPDRACEREDQAVDADAVDGLRLVDGEGGPLRGEQPKDCPVVEVSGQAEAAAGSARPTVVGGSGARQQRGRRVEGPVDLRLRVVLSPVAGLWARMSRGQQGVVRRAAERALGALSGIVDPPVAPQLLADRLADRLQEAGGEALVREPVGWLLGRGLVQRQVCPDPRCDDGIRLDTRSDCTRCGEVIAGRREVRARVRAELDEEVGGGPAADRRAAYEQRLRTLVLVEADRARVRQARETAAVQTRRAAAVRRQEADELARRSAPCAECGLLNAEGLCPPCTYGRRTDALVREAVDLAVAMRADAGNLAQVAGLTERCEADTRALVEAVCRRESGGDEAMAAFMAPEVAERIRDERRDNALRRLLACEEAEAEALSVYGTALRQRPHDLRAAEAAAEKARHRTARHVLGSLLGELRVVRARAVAGRGLRPAVGR